MKVLSKKEGGFYNNRILFGSVFVLMAILLMVFVYAIEGVTVSLDKPINTYNSSSLTVYFNCSPIASLNPVNVTNVTLWHNFSGTYAANETSSSATTLNGTNVSFTKTIAADGIYVWNCVACERNATNGSVCNSSTSNYTLTADATAPSIKTVRLLTSLTKKGSSQNVTVNVTDVTSGVATVTVDGVTLTQEGTGDTYSSSLVNISASPITVTVTDHAGNTATNGTVTITFDNTAPTTTYANDSDIDSDVWYGKDLLLHLSAIDTGGSVANTTEYRNGTSGTWSTWSANLTFKSNLSSNTFQFRSNDSLGNVEAYQSRTIKIDQTAPVVNIVSMSATEIGPSQTIAVSANMTDTLSGLNVSLLTAWHNGTGGNNGTNQVTLALQNGRYVGTITGPSSAGSYIVTVNATDRAVYSRNSNTATTAFTVMNLTAPTITSNVSNNTYITNGSVIGFTVVGANNTYYNTSETTAYSAPQSVTTSTTLAVTVTMNTSTSIEIQVHANKTDSNTTTKSYTYLVDDVIPPIAFSGLTANQVINGTTKIIAVSSDAGSGTAYVDFYDGSASGELSLRKRDNSTPFTYERDTLILGDGNFTLNITAVDHAGNVNSTMIHVTVNNSRPQTQAVTDGTADFGGTGIYDMVPQITGLNSTNAVVTVAKGDSPFISGSTDLGSPEMYINISADTAATARVYFRIPTTQITLADTTNLIVYMDHDDDGAYEQRESVTYVNSVGGYYNFYFATTSFSIFAIVVEASSPNTGSGGGGSGGGGGSSVTKRSIAFTTSGVSVGLKVDDKALFVFNKLTQTVMPTKISGDTATFKVMPSGEVVELTKGQSKDIDLDGDGVSDMNLKLDYVSGTTKAFAIIKKAYASKKAPSTAFEIIDVIKDFYGGSTTYTAFELIDIIRAFYGGT